MGLNTAKAMLQDIGLVAGPPLSFRYMCMFAFCHSKILSLIINVQIIVKNVCTHQQCKNVFECVCVCFLTVLNTHLSVTSTDSMQIRKKQC